MSAVHSDLSRSRAAPYSWILTLTQLKDLTSYFNNKFENSYDKVTCSILAIRIWEKDQPGQVSPVPRRNVVLVAESQDGNCTASGCFEVNNTYKGSDVGEFGFTWRSHERVKNAEPEKYEKCTTARILLYEHENSSPQGLSEKEMLPLCGEHAVSNHNYTLQLTVELSIERKPSKIPEVEPSS